MNYAIGDMVKFKWWSPYKAQSTCVDMNGHVIWNEIFPEELGVIIHTDDGTGTGTCVVFFARLNMLMKINQGMLEKVTV